MLKITLFILAAIWLPVTQHCALEAVGLLGDSHNDEGHLCCVSEPLGKCVNDNCPTLEEGDYTLPDAATPVLAPLPQTEPWLLCLLDFTELLCPQELNVTPVATTFERPKNFGVQWHFEHRAVCPPRAPSLLRS